MSLPIDDRLGHHIKRVEQELIAVKNAVLRPLGLNVPQYTVLLVLAEEPGLSGAALARRCLVTPQTMSTVLNTLESKELVIRQNHPIHTHIHEARLTRKGRSLLNRADVAAIEVEQKLGDEFTAQERTTLQQLLARCGAVLSKHMVEMKAAPTR
ncbi:MarR family winged helix-turn-helix transcriptional regulator [Saccharothrix syringae]|uniref:MarR family transcriptional regulator n=1 Tax=Saccharothrix syringae TaxID=103733 RepID=A0A5Q0GWJ9_SACSY|nr:MarR family transcriptional regulator [Saccharothrix syringae]QFZ17840.1 MarR family transcriptional regulator [Saccharothrix syringae]